MIAFLLKGILRDRSRSILPIIIVSIGVALTVLLSAYMKGVFGDVIDQNARFDTGHVKIMSRAYANHADQLPNDLSLLEVDGLLDTLVRDFPAMQWEKRIKFGGLLDVPDEQGESRGQGPATGMAINFFDANSAEPRRLNITNALVNGRMPQQSGEAMIGHAFFEKLSLSLGDEVTFFGTTMNSAMTFQNYKIVGTLRFGSAAMDKGLMMIDVTDAQTLLDMENASSELLGFSNQNVYQEDAMAALAANFNQRYAASSDEFAPVMKTLKEQNNLAEMIDYSNQLSSLFIFIFVIAMSVVLWNTGLLAGLRRYQEFGIRLALGEAKGSIYRRLLAEAAIVGFIGSVIGTLIGLAGAWYLQVVGIDIGDMLKDSTMLMPTTLRAEITPSLFYIGFVPGVLAMVLGTMLSGLGIFRRETARLFRELEV